MRETADFDGSLKLEESNVFLLAYPEDKFIEIHNVGLERESLYLDQSEAYLIWQMLGRSLQFLSTGG